MPGKNRSILPVLFAAIFAFSGITSGYASDKNPSASIVAGRLKRTYLIHVPAAHDKTRPAPLVIALHGGGGTGKNMMKLTQNGFDRLSDRDGFVVVYPEGIEKNWNDGRSGTETEYRAHKKNIDDVGFISALIDRLVIELNIDPQRVYVTGMSNGAVMSYRLACELAGKIAAIAPVTGNIALNLYPSCSPARPISVLAINSVNDPLMPFAGGDITGPFGHKKLGKVLSASGSINFWARHNNCSLSPAITYEPDKDPKDGTRARKETYGNCKDGTGVILYAIEDGGHTWPGGYQYLNRRIIGKANRDMDANEVIIDFFKRHPAR